MRLRAILFQRKSKEKTDRKIPFEAWPVIYASFIYLCYIHVQRYYQSFGLDIFGLLDYDELLFSFIPQLAKYGFAVAAVIYLGVRVCIIFDSIFKYSSLDISPKVENSAGIVLVIFYLYGATRSVDFPYLSARYAFFVPVIRIWVAKGVSIYYLLIIAIIFASNVFLRTGIRKQIKNPYILLACILTYGDLRATQGYMDLFHPFKSRKQYVFKYHGKVFSTESSRLIADTRHYIVLLNSYDSTKNKVILSVFSKEQIDSFVTISSIR